MENISQLSKSFFISEYCLTLFTDRFDPSIPADFVGLSSVQRSWLQLALNEEVQFEPFQLSPSDRNSFAGRMDLEVI